MSRLVLLTAALLAFGTAEAGRALAQDVDQDPQPENYAVAWDDEIPAHVSVVEGEVTLEREGVVEPVELNTILVTGDRLQSSRGRAEVLFADGSAFYVDEYSTIDFLSQNLLRLLDGRVRMTVSRSATMGYRIDAAAGSAQLRTAGEYRISLTQGRAASPQLELLVYSGSAELQNRYGTTAVRAGTFAVASADAAPTLPYATNSAAWDEFDRWADAQRDARLGYRSAQYLPSNLHYYSGSLDHYGTWGHADGYGHVWYPRVDAGWYPYSYGSWSFVAKFGWVWVGIDRWSWPTHHYGRWGHHGGRWFWIPHHRWAPAWVAWARGPGYIGWSPLGHHGRPLISINHFGPRLGWTVVHANTFRPYARVNRLAVSHDQLRPAVWSQFAEHRDGPGIAVPRNARGPGARPATATGAPDRTPRAVPRNGPRPTAAAPVGRAATPPAGSNPAARSAVRPSTTAPARATSRRVAPPIQPARDPISEPTRIAPSRVLRSEPSTTAPPRATPRGGNPGDVEIIRSAPSTAPGRSAVSRSRSSAAAPPSRPTLSRSSGRVIRGAPDQSAGRATAPPARSRVFGSPSTPPSSSVGRSAPSRSSSSARPAGRAPVASPRAQPRTGGTSGATAPPSRSSAPSRAGGAPSRSSAPPTRAEPARGRSAPPGSSSRGSASRRTGGGTGRGGGGGPVN